MVGRRRDRFGRRATTHTGRGERTSGVDPSAHPFRWMGDQVEIAVHDVEDFLDSPAGRRARRILAATAIVTAPLVFRIPGLKRYPLLRALELAGGAALVVKFAEAIRDWEPSSRRAIVIDVPDRTDR
jgi:hypothetical protein